MPKKKYSDELKLEIVEKYFKEKISAIRQCKNMDTSFKISQK